MNFSSTTLTARVLLAGPIAAPAGRDPGVYVALEKDFNGTADYGCIEKALRAGAPDVRRGQYQANGNGPRGFERGITVTQFNWFVNPQTTAFGARASRLKLVDSGPAAFGRLSLLRDVDRLDFPRRGGCVVEFGMER